ncbi:MAG: hypothetical protein FJ125_04310, partial [Deltaproteobacteria bacterium]|nr:hypothetical protein [Deltaproteobacteria bacterium]
MAGLHPERFAHIAMGDGMLPVYRTFGDLPRQRLATLVFDPSQLNTGPYIERTVERTSVFEFWSGFEAFQLTAPEGATWLFFAAGVQGFRASACARKGDEG